MNAKTKVEFGQDILETIREKLKSKGIDINIDTESADGCEKVKVVCVTPDLRNSVDEMGKKPRGETVMVRIDEESRNDLDAWVETDYFKSRSEAAALFMREGLKMRASELNELKEVLDQVQQAKSALHNKAQEIFGRDSK